MLEFYLFTNTVSYTHNKYTINTYYRHNNFSLLIRADKGITQHTMFLELFHFSSHDGYSYPRDHFFYILNNFQL